MRLSKISKTYKSFDNSQPVTPYFLKANPKRQLMERKKEEEIEKNNQILLMKMYQISKNPGKHSALKIYETLPHSHGTLNRHVRDLQEDRISTEN